MKKKEMVLWGVIAVVVIATAVILAARKRGETEQAQNWIARPESGCKKP